MGGGLRIPESSEGALCRTGYADERDEGKVWDGEFHSVIGRIVSAFYPQALKARYQIVQGEAHL